MAYIRECPPPGVAHPKSLIMSVTLAYLLLSVSRTVLLYVEPLTFQSTDIFLLKRVPSRNCINLPGRRSSCPKNVGQERVTNPCKECLRGWLHLHIPASIVRGMYMQSKASQGHVKSVLCKLTFSQESRCRVTSNR